MITDRRADNSENGADTMSSRDLFDAVSAVTMIEAMLGEEDRKGYRSEVSFDLPLNEAVKLIPRQYFVAAADDPDLPKKVTVTKEDLFKQLAAGKVTMTVAQLAYFVPSHLLSHAAFEDTKTVLRLPLAVVVNAVGLDKLRERRHGGIRDFGAGTISDPFAKGARMPSVVVEPAARVKTPVAPGPGPLPRVAKKAEREEQAEPVTPAPGPERAPAKVSGSEDSFELPIGDAIALLPEKYLKPGATDSSGRKSVTIAVHDLYDQLVTGRVELSVAQFACFLPQEIVSESAFRDEETQVRLPLNVVVQAVGPDKLRARTTRRERRYDTEGMEDPFKEDFRAGRPKPAPHIGAPAAQEEEREEKEGVSVEETGAEQPAEPAGDRVYAELPGTVDVNSAGIGELMSVPGVSGALASRIINYRNEHGPFRSIFDLGNVPGLGRKTFKRMTGMPLSNKRLHRRQRLSKLLGIPFDKVHELQAITDAVTTMPGFSGCIVSDSEGLLLAQSGLDDGARNISAVAPKIARSVRRDMDVVEGCVDSISVVISGKMYTVAGNDSVTLTAIHEESRVTKTQLVFVHKVWRELDWLLSHRIYAGATST